MRLAPGVRVRVSSRGVSAGLGPRVARVHVGARGGVGVSSGAGPFSAYLSLTPHSSRSRALGQSRGANAADLQQGVPHEWCPEEETAITDVSAAKLREASAAKIREASAAEMRQVSAANQAWLYQHLVVFPRAVRADIAVPLRPDRGTAGRLVRARYARSSKSIRWYRIPQRRKLKNRVVLEVWADLNAQHDQACADQQQAQSAADSHWNALCVGSLSRVDRLWSPAVSTPARAALRSYGTCGRHSNAPPPRRSFGDRNCC
jgi:Protein of unknown function (DUF4236)